MAVVLPITVSNKLSLSLSTACFGDFGEMAFERRENICGGNCALGLNPSGGLLPGPSSVGWWHLFSHVDTNLEFRGLEGIQGMSSSLPSFLYG